MHAVLYHVDRKQGWGGDEEAELDMIEKMSKETPGFIRGFLANNDEHGISVQLYESEETAKAAAATAGSIPPEASVTFVSVEVFGVRREI
jgi:hypothetical protein